MKVVTSPSFVCEFCPRKKRYARRADAIWHEERCFYNPIRQACVTCKHFSKERPEPPDWSTNYPGYPGGLFCALDLIPKDKAMLADCDEWEAREHS